MLNRYLKEFGLPPIIGYLLAMLIFVGASFYLFSKTKYAAYIYAFFGVSPLSLLSETKRNDFLKSCFIAKDYWLIRLLENILVVLPFILFLGYQLEWLMVVAVLLIAALMARFQLNNQLNYTIPTPFYKYPFEFIVGFRTAFFMIIFAYFLTFMGITVDNFNLGAFAILLIFFISFSFYAQPDSLYYVWIFSDNSKEFLFSKIKIAFVYSGLLTLPILIGLGIYFPDKMKFIILIPMIGYVYLLTIILAKYAAFPRAMNLLETILIGASVLFPPFLLFVIPYFYRKSKRQLNRVLLG